MCAQRLASTASLLNAHNLRLLVRGALLLRLANPSSVLCVPNKHIGVQVTVKAVVEPDTTPASLYVCLCVFPAFITSLPLASVLGPMLGRTRA